MADTIEIVQGTATVVEVAGPTGPQGPAGAAGATGAQGPQGVPGTGLEVLTTQGDLLYQGASTGQRLPIGSTGQILKVAGGIPSWANESGAVSSVAGKTGVVTLDKNDVGLGNVSNTAQVTSVTGTAPISSSGGTTPAISISAATTSAAGSMSAADKTKLDGIASGATANTASSATPQSLGTAAAGTSADFSRADHVHSADLLDSAFRVVGSSDATKKVAFEVDGLTTATTRTITVPNKNITLDDAGDSRTPTAHAASHSAGRQAIFVGTVAGMTTPVVIQADNAGTAGNSITLSFNGSSDIDAVISAWNSANPSNPATLIGDDAQIPNNATSITLSQGTAAGSDAIATPHFTNLSVGSGKTINLGPNYGQFTSASGNAGFTINRGDDSGYASIDLLQRADAGTGWSMQMQPSNNDLHIVNRVSSVNQLTLPASGTAAINALGNIEITDTDNSTTGTLVAYTNLTANRTYDLPDASGTLALTSDIPALGTGAGEAAEGNHGHGNLTNDGKLGSTAGLPVVTTTAGAVTTLALGTAGQILRTKSDLSGVEFADPAASGVTGAAASASDVLGVSGSNITGVDAGSADRLVFWDDSASKLTYLEAGSGLSISGTTLTATASGTPTQTDVFTANGTYTKPAGAKIIRAVLVGGGGGGGAGRRGAAGTVRAGGGGGGGAAVVAFVTDAAYFGATESITVGSGGNGGANSADDTNGANGSDGGNSSIGSLVTAIGGKAGGGGSTAGGSAGAATGSSVWFYGTSTTSTGGGGGGAAGNAGAGSASTIAPTGGGGGGGINDANNALAGGQSGNFGSSSYGLYNAQSTNPPTVQNGKDIPYAVFGTGGAGTRATQSGSVGNQGGNGARGGGGGGGSGALNGAGGSTAGGSGGNGIVVITTYF